MVEALYGIGMRDPGKQTAFDQAKHQLIIVRVNMFRIDVVPEFRFMIKSESVYPVNGAYRKIKRKRVQDKINDCCFVIITDKNTAHNAALLSALSSDTEKGSRFCE